MNLTLENVKILVEITAILTAGVWAYCKFVKGRLFRHKLDIELTGNFFNVASDDHIHACIYIKNAGFTRVNFDNEYCVLRIFIPKYRPKRHFTDAAIWHRVATISILNDHRWIEPSEVIREEELISLEQPIDVAVRLEVSISDSRSLWQASSVIVKTHSQ